MCVLFSNVAQLVAQDTQPLPRVQRGGLLPDDAKNQRLEINELRIDGNTAFTTTDLSSLLSSRANELSFGSTLLLTLEDNLKPMPTVLQTTRTWFSNAYKTIEETEIRRFDKSNADYDAQVLMDFYNQHGYHNAKVTWEFRINQYAKRNILFFHVNEGKQYFIDTIVTEGLSNLPPSVLQSITAVERIKKGDAFNEQTIKEQIGVMLGMLQDSGYAKANLDTLPLITSNDSTLLDSVYLRFTIGKRVKIGSITLIDSLRAQPVVAYKMKRDLLAIHEGEYYSPTNIERTRSTYSALGTFDRIVIDTTQSNDTTYNLSIITQYRNAQEISGNIFTNRTTDNLLNTGLELSYAHRNIFGAAQGLGISGVYQIQDVASFLASSKDYAYEVKLRLFFNQPYFFTLANTQWDLGLDFVPSYRIIANPFKLLSYTPRATFVSGIATNWRLRVDFTFDWQRPFDYIQGQNEAIDRALALNPNADTNRILATFALYRVLNQESNNKLTFVLFSISPSITYDTRNNIFAPSGGQYFNGNIETSFFGISRFTKLHGLYSHYTSVSSQWVGAIKARAGYIFWDNTSNTYVPIERHFFAGGANSVRSFEARKLRDKASGGSSDNIGVLDDFIGSAMLLEASAELRYTFPYYESLGDFWAQQLHEFGYTLFVDAGNTFKRFTNEDYGKSISPLHNLAVAAGFGITRNLPIGPFRLDFALPIHTPGEPLQSISQMLSLNKLRLQIGLGYSF